MLTLRRPKKVKCSDCQKVITGKVMIANGYGRFCSESCFDSYLYRM